MREVLKSLKENQVSTTVLSQLEASRDLGQKRKHKESWSEEQIKKMEEEENNKNKEDSDEVMEEKEEGDEIEEESKANIEEEENKPVNIFAMKSYENTKKVKIEDMQKKPKKTDEEEDMEHIEKIIKEELQANVTVNPFKDFKRKPKDDDDDKPDEEEKRIENFVEIFDPELRKLVEGTSAKYNQLIERSEEITKTREKLPVFMRESDIIEAVNNNLITIISGETGSGSIS